LVLEALAGNEAACETLIRRYERPVFNLLVRLVRDRGQAEDIAQDTFLKMFRALASYDPRLRFSSWLFRIAHNSAIDHLRRVRPGHVPFSGDLESDEPAPESWLADPRAVNPDRELTRLDLSMALEDAMARLRPEYREVMALRYEEDLDYDEIAHVLGLPLGTVKTHLHRARHEIGRHLAAAGWGPDGR
jgi:RNA polymerase sigma-70 factor, ECF subfamily